MYVYMAVASFIRFFKLPIIHTITAMQKTFEIDAFNQVTDWLLQFTACFKNVFKEDDAKTS